MVCLNAKLEWANPDSSGIPARWFQVALGPIYSERALAESILEARWCQSYMCHLGYLIDGPATFHR